MHLKKYFNPPDLAKPAILPLRTYPLGEMGRPADGHRDPIQSAHWSQIPKEDLDQWTLRLANEKDASIRQYPFFNERFHRRLTQPVFLGCRDSKGEITGFACVISLGFAGVKFGAVIDGPVAIGGSDLSDGGVENLSTWLRSSGFAFVRFSCCQPSVIDKFAVNSRAVFANPLPFVPRYGGELAVHLAADDTTMLAC